MKRTFLKILLWGAGLLALFCVLLVIGAASALTWLSSADGRNWIALQVEKQASAEKLQIDIETIETLTTKSIVLSGLSVSDTDGPIARLKNISVTYDLTSLMNGHIFLSHIKAEDIDIVRLPEQSGDKERSDLPALPESPYLTIEKLSLPSITFAENVLGSTQSLRLSGSLSTMPQWYGSALSFVLENKVSGNKLAAANIDLGRNRALILEADINDEGNGIISALTGYAPFKLEINGRGTAEEWRGNLTLNAGDTISAAQEINISLQETPVITLKGKASYETYSFDGIAKTRIDSEQQALDMELNGNTDIDGTALENMQAHITAMPENNILGSGKIYPLEIKANLTAQEVMQGEEIGILSGAKAALHFTLQETNIALHSTDITLSSASINASGKIDLVNEQAELKVQAQAPDISALSKDINGQANAEITMAGSWNPLSIHGPATLQTANISTPWPFANDLLGTSPAIKTTIEYNGEVLKLNNGTLQAAGLAATEFSGEIFAKSGHRFTVSTGYEDYDVRSALVLQDNIINFETLSVSGPAGAAEGSGAIDTAAGEIRQADLVIHPQKDMNITARLSGPFEAIAAQGEIEAKAIQGLTPLSYRATLTTEGDPDLLVQELSGRYENYDLRLRQPAKIFYANSAAQVSPFLLGLNDGTLSVGGTFGAETMDMKAVLENIAALPPLVPVDFTGTMSGTVTLSGNYTSPQGQAEISLSRVSLPLPGESAEHFIDGRILADYADNTLKAQAEIKGPANISFDGNAVIPVTLVPFALPENKPVQAELDGTINLESVALLLGMDEQKISGKADLNAALSGTVKNPVVTGTGVLSDVTYENFLTGTYLTEISAAIEADAERITLKGLSGRGRDKGTFSGSGFISVDDLRNPRYEFMLESQNLQIVSTADLSVIASGNLESEGDKKGGAIKGSITIDHAEYFISEIISTNALGNYEIIEGEQEQKELSQQNNKESNITLDLKVSAPNKIYVRAPDLETEWSGDLGVKGTISDPEVKGKMALVRGRFQLLDTPVTLSKGSIIFGNAGLSNPALDIIGLMEGDSLDATLRISGTSQSPEVGLSSEPPYPEDEILARTLFGKSVSDLSPVQALRIAQLMAYLSGQSVGGFDPLGTIRQAIGVDTLNVSVNDDEGATLSAGKYISDRVYIGIDQGMTPESSAVRSEIELTEEIEVETVTGSTENKVGINWKRDY